MSSATSVVGTWDLRVDWGDDGAPVQAKPLTFNADGTWTYAYGGGKWVQAEGLIAWSFNNAPGLVYTSNVTFDAMSGIMGYSNTDKGCFYAVRQGAGAVQVAVPKMAGAKDQDIMIGANKHN